jgi:hypothetical protein
MQRCLLPILFFFLATASTQALGPHEVLVLVNANSPHSIEIANTYIRLRGIPPINVVQVQPPATATAPEARITPEEFTRTIWEPAQNAMRERRLTDHILAWVYSADFPMAIRSNPEVSLQGLTFTHNQLPEVESINKGTYVSRLFAGPGRDLKQRGAPRSLEQYALILTTNMPLPSISLAHTGLGGETLDEAVARLQTSARLNGAPLPGGVFFLTSDNIRTTCRSWQFEDAVAELKMLGQTAQILPIGQATRSSKAWGLMAGIARPEPASLPRLVPGSLAEHLTSFAAFFHGQVEQLKLTGWLQAGAAGSSGTVTEPYALWTKFPTARLFVHYASGCTLLESFAQSVASPMQMALVGDPLLAPWAKPQGVTLVSLADEADALSGTVEFAASTWAGPRDPEARIFYLLDGRSVLASGTPPLVHLNTTQLADGYHELRAIVYSGGLVRHQGYSTLGFTVNNHGRRIALSGLVTNEVLTVESQHNVRVKADPPPRELALLHNETLLARQPWTDEGAYVIDASLLGAGPNAVQLVAVYEDGEMVRSAPVPVQVTRPKPPITAPPESP